jgi:hypothetical protein
MEKETLTILFERALLWSPEKQAALIEVIHDMDEPEYHASEEELRLIDEALNSNEFVSEEEVFTLLRSYRLQ